MPSDPAPVASPSPLSVLVATALTMCAHQCVPILLANGHIRDEQRYATKEMTCMLFFLPLILILPPPPAPPRRPRPRRRPPATGLRPLLLFFEPTRTFCQKSFCYSNFR